MLHVQFIQHPLTQQHASVSPVIYCFSFSLVEDVDDLERGAGTFVQAQVADTKLMSDTESEDRASTVNDGEAFEEDADVGDGGAFEENAVDDGGADAYLCDSM